MGNPESHSYDEVNHSPNLDHYEIMKPVVSITELPNFLTSEKGKKFIRGINRKESCIDGRVDPFGAQGSAGSSIDAEKDPEVAAMLTEKEAEFKDGKISRTQYFDILASAMPSRALMENEANMIRNGELDEITYHPGCGAANKYLVDHGVENASPEEVNYVARKFVENKVAILENMSGKKIKISESKAEGDHQEVVTYVDSTKRLDLIVKDSDVQLPNGFLISPSLLNNDPLEIVKQVMISLSIAFNSHHGKGLKYFSENPPYPILLVDCKENPLPKGLKAIIESKVSEFLAKMRKSEAVKKENISIPDNIIEIKNIDVVIPPDEDLPMAA